jgi:hypothetical protein
LGRLLPRGLRAHARAVRRARVHARIPAGLLYGQRRADIPGFAWFDRAAAREVRMDRSDDARAVEAALRERSEGLRAAARRPSASSPAARR